MTSIDELIETMSVEDYTNDNIQFIIDEDLRTVTIPSKGVIAGVVGDKNINRINFKMVKNYNGFDMSDFEIRINYKNAIGTMNYFIVNEKTITNDSILFSWIVESDVTNHPGKVEFAVTFISYNNLIIERRFNTAISTINVLEGLNVDSQVPIGEMQLFSDKIKSDIEEYVNNEVIPTIPNDYTNLDKELNKYSAHMAINVTDPVYIKCDTNTKKFTLNETEYGYGFVFAQNTFVKIGDMVNDTVSYESLFADNSGKTLMFYVHNNELKIAEFGSDVLVNEDIIVSIIYFENSETINKVVFDVCQATKEKDEENEFSRIAAPFRGTIKIDETNKKVYINDLGVIYGKGLEFEYTLDDDVISYSGNANPTYLQAILFDPETLKVSVVGHGDYSSENDKYQLMAIFHDGRILYSTTNLPGIFYINGVDPYAIFSDRELIRTYNLLNRLTCKIFKKVVCIGDSYTAGYIVDSNDVVHNENYDYSWPTYMSSLTGNEYVNCGVSGSTTRSWWNDSHGGLKAFLPENKPQAYIIGLQLNDASDRDVHVDVGDYSDIGTNADTYFGWMSKIVDKCMYVNPKAHVFIQTTPRYEPEYDEYNDAIREIVNYYSESNRVHCLDLAAYKHLYCNDSLVNDEAGWHYTAVGYEQFAEILAYILSEYINENVEKFQDVFLIDYAK